VAQTIMIDILITSKDAARLSQVVHVLGECGDYRTTRAADSPSLLLERGDSLDAFDVLIVDALSSHDAELPVVAQLCQKHKHLSCILVTPDASPDTLIAAMRAGFRDVLNWPLERRALGDALVRLEAQRLKTNTHTTEIVSFMSCKGGVGTSFIAANVADAIANVKKKRVLMIDLNQLFGDAAFLVTSETPPSTLPQLCSQIDRMDHAFFDASVLHVSDTFHILAGAGDPVKAAELKEDRLEWILGVASPRYDFVIFDLGQTINPISMLALDRSDQIHIVLQASMPNVRAGRRLQEILGSLGYAPERMRLLLNRYSRHEERARAALEQVLGTRPFQVIPDDAAAVADAINQGLPILRTTPKSGVSRSLQTLAGNIAGRAAKAGTERARSASLLARMFGRAKPPKLEMPLDQQGKHHVAS
jgi:pilus assembly protein CpaE